MVNLSAYQARHKVVRALAPEAARCPHCCHWAERNEIRSRLFWVPDLCGPCVIEVVGGCYICRRCPPGQQWFMLLPAEFDTRRQYSLLGYRTIVDLVREHRMSVEEAAAVGRKVLHLCELDAATVLAWVRHDGESLDTKGRLAKSAAAFSGELALDEVYDGEWYQLKATDPLNGIELAWKLERGAPSEDDVKSFLLDLKAVGIDPKLVVTDGSTLYPSVLAEVWPNAKHQRCVFHFIKQINEDLGKAFWEIYDAMPVRTADAVPGLRQRRQDIESRRAREQGVPQPTKDTLPHALAALARRAARPAVRTAHRTPRAAAATTTSVSWRGGAPSGLRPRTGWSPTHSLVNSTPPRTRLTGLCRRPPQPELPPTPICRGQNPPGPGSKSQETPRWWRNLRCGGS